MAKRDAIMKYKMFLEEQIQDMERRKPIEEKFRRDTLTTLFYYYGGKTEDMPVGWPLPDGTFAGMCETQDGGCI